MNIAVIGTGTMGPAIAYVFAQCEQIDRVMLCKGRTSSMNDGMENVLKTANRLVDKNKLTAEKANQIISKIISGELEDAGNSDLLVEAVVEDLEIKRDVFLKLDRICAPSCVFTSNTSSIPIKQIAEGINRPLTGMHFFNPAPIMRLVEVVVLDNTPQEVVEFIMQTSRMIGKEPVQVQEAPGYIVNRVLIPMINESISILAEGVSSAEDIDRAMYLGANHPIGPLALGDLIGLDIVLAILNTMLKETCDPRYIPQPLLKRMVREKKLGRKTGQGFYSYRP